MSEDLVGNDINNQRESSSSASNAENVFSCQVLTCQTVDRIEQSRAHIRRSAAAAAAAGQPSPFRRDPLLQPVEGSQIAEARQTAAKLSGQQVSEGKASKCYHSRAAREHKSENATVGERSCMPW